jgi:hypothetical protein
MKRKIRKFKGGGMDAEKETLVQGLQEKEETEIFNKEG